MKQFNSITVLGKVTSKPQYKHVGESGLHVLSFNLDCKNGKVGKETTTTFRVNYWKKEDAEDLSCEISHGSICIVIGELTTHTYKSWKDYNQEEASFDIYAQQISLVSCTKPTQIELLNMACNAMQSKELRD